MGLRDSLEAKARKWALEKANERIQPSGAVAGHWWGEFPVQMEVAPAGRQVAASISMSGAVGSVVGALEISLPPAPAAG